MPDAAPTLISDDARTACDRRQWRGLFSFCSARRVRLPASVRPRPRIVSVLGSRPEVIQAAALSRSLHERVDEILVNTGQHYDRELDADQITDTRLRQPDYNLGVGSRPDQEQLSMGTRLIGEVIDSERPDGVLVRGDTNATLAGAQAASARGVPLVHVEAGLRSYRSDMPEERNRVLTDGMADVLCAPTEAARANLERERVPGQIHVTGDVLCDIFLEYQARLGEGNRSDPYVLATIHRGYNTDDPARLAVIVEMLNASPWRVIWPIHPRTRKAMAAADVTPSKHVEVMPPVTYTEMLLLERDARVIATDSGGVQREAYLWGVPCVTVREETEWTETVETGWNSVVGVDPDAFAEALQRPRPREHPPIFGNGRAGESIARVVAEYFRA